MELSPEENKALDKANEIMTINLGKNPGDYNELLRLLTLSINWDNQKSPAVWSPLGDFFGTAPGINKYKSLVMGITDSSSLRPEASKGARCQRIEEKCQVSG